MLNTAPVFFSINFSRSLVSLLSRFLTYYIDASKVSSVNKKKINEVSLTDFLGSRERKNHRESRWNFERRWIIYDRKNKDHSFPPFVFTKPLRMLMHDFIFVQWRKK